MHPTDLNFVVRGLHLDLVLEIVFIISIHYENKSRKTFRPTNILYIFTKFWFKVFHRDFFCNKSAKY